MQTMLEASYGTGASPKLPIYRDVCTVFIFEEIVQKWRIYAVYLCCSFTLLLVIVMSQG